jgi:glycosyltransferase involved in cell wall biosynthesis
VETQLTMSGTKIIVITPVKNESWILDKFLSVSSIFADHIIIADQQSTDDSREICKQYPKVLLIENRSLKFNEAERQIMLIDAARKLCPDSKRILLALDADEILAANAIGTSDWQLMLDASEGTILYFEKPTFCNGTKEIIRYSEEGWPLGYVDDGKQHEPRKIHSSRIPTPSDANKLNLKGIKILHYGLARPNALSSKLRYYSCLECIMDTQTMSIRRISYPDQLDFSNEGLFREPINKDWIQKWQDLGINMLEVKDTRFNWYDQEVLNFFSDHGFAKFHSEDIWKFDWNAAAKHFGMDAALGPIKYPNPMFTFYLVVQTTIFKNLRLLKNRINKLQVKK